MEHFTNILDIITRENGIILILILLLFIDKARAWIKIIENSYRKWLKLDKEEANKNLENYTLKVAKIHEILEIYRKAFNASRVGYYVLHNGNRDIRGIPFLKYSCMNEAIDFGVRPRLHTDRDMGIASLAGWTKEFTTGTSIIGYTDKLSQSTLRGLLECYNITKYAIIPLYEDSLLSGFIAVEWHNERHIPLDNAKINEYLIQCGRLVELNNIKDINYFLEH